MVGMKMVVLGVGLMVTGGLIFLGAGLQEDPAGRDVIGGGLIFFGLALGLIGLARE